MSNWTKEQQKEHRKLWIEALRSGEYKQGRNFLALNETYCCLGVACEVAMKHGVKLKVGIDDDFLVTSYDFETTVVPTPVKDFFGLTTSNGGYVDEKIPMNSDNWIFGNTTLADKNDNDMPFDKIANIIESEPKGLVEND